ncbi:MAG: acetyltransferase [Abditibacteriota bacterium]|nr:acetyltransferase [Abditibacteriota bacterium]
MKKLIVFGAGGFGREFMFLAEAGRYRSYPFEEHEILGFVDDTPELAGQVVNGYPVLGDSEWLKAYPEPVDVFLCVGIPSARKAIYENLSVNKNLSFPPYIASEVLVAPSTEIGEGAFIAMFTVLTINTKVGRFVHIHGNNSIGHDCVLEDFCTLYSKVNISGYTHVCEGAEIYSSVTTVPHITVGKNTKVAACACVTKDLPDNCLAAGVPAVIKKYFDTEPKN